MNKTNRIIFFMSGKSQEFMHDRIIVQVMDRIERKELYNLFLQKLRQTLHR